MSPAGGPGTDEHPDLEWAASGAMSITGRAEGPPELAPAPVATVARGAIAALAGVTEASRVLDADALRVLDAPALLGERAAIAGQSRRGSTSVGGTCHLLRCANGWIAVNLARPEDVALLPAWLEEGPVEHDVRAFVATRVRHRETEDNVARARSLGLPVAPVASSGVTGNASWLRVAVRGDTRADSGGAPPLVIDLSALWAGPLCTHLLALAGARVIKVESSSRPDGARRGPARFFDLMNGDKKSVALDLSTNDGVRILRALVERADIVVESSRPRALRQLGIVAEDIVSGRPGRVWVAITGYGRETPMEDWVAFGDDAAASAGLVVWPEATGGEPAFCGDAVADPLTGMHAALAALAHWHRGEGALLDVSLQRVAAYVASQPVAPPRAQVRAQPRKGTTQDWEVAVAERCCIVAPPRARAVTKKARDLGADTRDVLQELVSPC